MRTLIRIFLNERILESLGNAATPSWRLQSELLSQGAPSSCAAQDVSAWMAGSVLFGVRLHHVIEHEVSTATDILLHATFIPVLD